MKTLTLSVLALVTLVLFTGCGQVQPDVTKIIYRDKECPTPKLKPDFIKYEAVVLDINGVEYYAFQKSEALKLVTNWVSYREWAESNYILLKKDTTKPTDSKTDKAAKE